MGKNILYIANYYLEDVIEQRNSAPFISQAGQNKSTYMLDMLRAGGNQVTVWSNAWTKSTSGRYYAGFHSAIDASVYYSDIIGIPFLNVWACKKSCKKFLREYEKKNHFDVIVFYNMRLENAPVALWAKRRYGSKLILQYEDGLTRDANVKGLKRFLYRQTEKKMLPQLDGAFLVNGKLKVPCPALVVRGAIRDRRQKGDAPAKQKPMLLYAGTLDEQRGIRVVLDALRYTEEDFTLVITGRGDLEKEVRSCQDARVDFRGYVAYTEYEELLKKADICINAQLSNAGFSEASFPSKLYEYLSYGKLIISSDVADVKEAIGNLGFIYENDSEKELARCIGRAAAVAANEEELQVYKARIRIFLKENSITKMAEKANELLDK